MIRQTLSACLAAVLATQGALAQSVPATAAAPEDAVERGLIMQMDEAEKRLKTSQFVIRDAALNAYLREVL